jgi:hypothetical protein
MIIYFGLALFLFAVYAQYGTNGFIAAAIFTVIFALVMALPGKRR